MLPASNLNRTGIYSTTLLLTVLNTATMSISDTAESTESPTITESRSCTINTDGEGEPLGATVFLSADQLMKIGVNPTETDSVSYHVQNGQLILSD